MRWAAITLCVLITGCSYQPNFIPYSSEANIPVRTDVSRTNVVYISPDSEENVYWSVGVFAGQENEQDPYLIIAPRRPTQRRSTVNPFLYFNLALGVHMSLDKAEKFISILNVCEQEWNNEYSTPEAIYREYHHTEEPDIEMLSENVVKLHSSLRFMFQSNSTGSMAYLWLGEAPYRQGGPMEKSIVKTFRKTLERGAIQAKEMSFRTNKRTEHFESTN